MGRLVLTLLSFTLASPAALATGASNTADLPDPSAITWERAFLVGSVTRSTPSTTAPLDMRNEMPAEIHLVLEGVHDGLPIYGSPVPRLRIEGRAIPERMVLDTQHAGLTNVEIRWVELRPLDTTGNWRRTRLPEAAMHWTLINTEFAGEEAPGMSQKWGTGRFAAAIGATAANGEKLQLSTQGWAKSKEWANPEFAPGYRVTRTRGIQLVDRAVGLARLPVDPQATDTHCRRRIALRPSDLVLAAYEDMGGIRMPTPRAEPLTGEAWSWFFTLVTEDLFRRHEATAALVTPQGRGFAWGRGIASASNEAFRGDVLLAGDAIALLDKDDGDGWLGEGDTVLHTMSGHVQSGRLADLPERKLSVLRPRDFLDLKTKLEEAGYGPFTRTPLYDARLQKACREFQRDRELEVTGIPDTIMLDALREFLERMRDAAATGEGEATP